MRVNTGSSGVFDFSLTGRETQDSIEAEKYIALAYSSPRGVALAELVETRWHEWVEKVATAPWLRNWQRSLLRGSVATTPRGVICEKVAKTPDLSTWSGVALAIYVNTVWGIGLEQWLKGPAQSLGVAEKTRLGPQSGMARVNEPMVCILQLQNVRCPNQARTYMWDEVLYRGCGIHLPIEVGELDRWLEPLWLEVLEMELEAQKLAYKNSLK